MLGIDSRRWGSSDRPASSSARAHLVDLGTRYRLKLPSGASFRMRLTDQLHVHDFALTGSGAPAFIPAASQARHWPSISEHSTDTAMRGNTFER